MSQRVLVDHWYWGSAISDPWEKSRVPMEGRLRNLERILGVLHDAVEYPAAPVAGIAFEPGAGADTTINSTTPAAITGVTFTLIPDVDMSLLVTGHFLVEGSLFGAVNQYFLGYISINGAVQTSAQQAITSVPALNGRAQASQAWVLSLVAGTSYTIELAGATTNVATTFLVKKLHTTITWLQLPNLYQVA